MSSILHYQGIFSSLSLSHNSTTSHKSNANRIVSRLTTLSSDPGPFYTLLVLSHATILILSSSTSAALKELITCRLLADKQRDLKSCDSLVDVIVQRAQDP